MKHICTTHLLFIFFFAVLSPEIVSAGNWKWQNPLPQGNDLHAIGMINSDTGWVVGENGLMMRTTDGGSRWTIEPELEPNNLTGITFTDVKNGWIVGYGGLILHTSDGGLNWLRQLSGVSNDLNDVAFTDDKNGWIIGGKHLQIGCRILHTSDGGKSWSTQYTNLLSTLSGITFTDHLNGYAWDVPRTFLRTTDGGITWTSSKKTPYSLYGVVFVNALTAWGLRSDGSFMEIVNTTDGGEKLE